MCSRSDLRTTQTWNAHSMKPKGCSWFCDCIIRWTSLSQSSKASAKDYLGTRLFLGWIWSYWEVLYIRKADVILGKTCFSSFYRSWGPHEYICLYILPPNPTGFRILGFPSWFTLDLLWGPKHAGSPTLFPLPKTTCLFKLQALGDRALTPALLQSLS